MNVETKTGIVKVNSNGVNEKIKANILTDSQMEKIGFTNYNKPHWYYSRCVKFPKKYKDFDISFSLTIPKDGSDISIDILDEDFCQPYDYQYMLDKDPCFESCIIVRDFVEEQMEYLKDAGILTGHIKGEYI